MKKIYLSTYSLKILDRRTECTLSQFDGKTDFFDFFKNFMLEIYQNVKKTHSFKDSIVLHLTIDEPVDSDSTSRTIYGYISSGVGGDKFKVRAEGETEAAFEADPNKHITFRNLFFYLDIPRNKNYAYLIIQKKRDLGAKGLLEKALNIYFKEKGYMNYFAKISNLLNGRIYDKMMDEGNLKNIDLIKRKIPSSIEDYYEKGEKSTKGTLTTSIRAPFSLGQEWKDFINKIYKKDYVNHTVELDLGVDAFDEVEFELELNKKIKTFHVIAKGRTQPDIEVSSDLEFSENEPTKDSLIVVSKGLVEDLLVLNPHA